MLIANTTFYITFLLLIGKTFAGCWLWEFECGDGSCIPVLNQCDGIKQCKDGSDESKCGTLSTKKDVTSTTVKRTTEALSSRYSKPVSGIVTVGHSPVYLQTTENEIVWFSRVSTIGDADVKILCKDRTLGKLTWYKSDGDGLLPEGSQKYDYLVLKRIKCKDAGTYVCYPSTEPENRHRYGTLKLEVTDCAPTPTKTKEYTADNTRKTQYSPDTQLKISTTSLRPITEDYARPFTISCANSTVNGSCCYLYCDRKNCNTSTAPEKHFSCADGSFIPIKLRCNGRKDCRDGSDEFNCQRICKSYEFRCSNGACIPGSSYCDNEIDCEDASDELACSGTLAPKITELPQRFVEIDCMDVKDTKSNYGSHILQLECRFAGKPKPLVKWKKYEGHVPTKCVQSSIDGYGILKCPNFQQSDQGAYSCVAENLVGSAESQPKSIVKCRQLTCDKGFIVSDEHGIETCLECFCSGKSTKCRRIQSELVKHTFDFPTIPMDMLVNNEGEVFMPNMTNVNLSFQRVKYCSIPEETLSSHSFIESYGRNLIVPGTYKDKSNFAPNAPDVIIRGNDLMLMYSFNKISHTSPKINIRFWKGDWYHSDKRVASRHDILNVLSQLDLMLFRCEYEENTMVSPGSKIVVESSKVAEDSKSVSYLEKCTCPKEYTGLSCQSCAPGFERDTTSFEFSCRPKVLVPKFCPLGTKKDDCDCDTRKLHYLSSKNKTCELSKCTNIGSIGIFPDINDDCICKERVTGKYCDTCKDGFFYLDALSPVGCKKCWCNNVTRQCSSSKWYTTTISSTSSGGYNASSGGNFWLLPPEFNGNRLSSYGGFLRYKLKYLQSLAKQPNPLTVEILSGNDITLKYIDANIDLDTSSEEKLWNIQIEEPFWRDDMNISVTRERLLQVLVNVKAIYVQSPYHLSSGAVIMTRVDLDVAEDMSNYADSTNEGERASKVEQCVCPTGYTGLSCESCSDGYYKKWNSMGGYECKLCDCAYCDPELGCVECKKGEYQDNIGSSASPVCLKCPCNGNEEHCQKDQMGQVICSCKTGYSGIFCESVAVTSHLKMSIVPARLVNIEVGALVTFNCSYESTEKMQISFQKKYRVGHADSSVQDFKRIENYGSVSIIEIAIEEDLIAIDCIVRNENNEESGRISATIVGTVTGKIAPKITNCYEEPSRVIENEDLQLICEASGNPEPVIAWYALVGNNSEKLDTVNGVHTLTNASLQQNGTSFLCIAENSAGDDKCSTLVIVKRRCDVITIIPSNLVVYENQTAQFNCTTTNGSKVTWSYNDSPLPSGASVYDGRLVIKQAYLYHSGKYTCSAVGSDGPLVKSVNLSVRRERVPPKALIRQEDMEVSSGNSVEINCDVSGFPVPKVTWSKIGSLFLPFNTHKSANGLNLYIKSFKAENIGFYECKAEYGQQYSTSRIHIIMTEKPEIRVTPSEVNAKLGESFTIECQVIKGSPPPQITWLNMFNWSEISKERKLIFNSARFEDAGKYQCKAENSAGMATAVTKVFVGDAPDIVLIPEGKISAIVGDYFDIECIVTGTPQATIKWLKWQKMSRRTNGNGKSNGYLTPPELLPEEGPKLKVTVSQDLSKITCEAENEFGKVNKSVVFHVQGGQKPNSDVVKWVKLGSPVQLIFTDRHVVTKCRRKHSSLIGDECYIKNGLEIASVQVQHNGTYICSLDTGEEKSSDIIVVGFVQKFKKQERSYMKLPLAVPPEKHFTVEVTFKADNETGIILLKRSSDFSMYLSNGRLRVRLSRPSDKVVFLEPAVKLKLEVWYTAVFSLNKSAELSIYDDQGLKIDTVAKSPLEMVWNSNYEDLIYVGGARPSGVKLPLRWSDAAFGGCISRLIIYGHEYKITQEASYSKNVSLCSICSSSVDPCGNEGVCYDAPTHYGYVCVCEKGTKCPASCRGLGCRSNLDLCELIKPCHQVENRCVTSGASLRCECGAGYSGVTCKDEVAYQFGLNQDGYVKLPAHYLPRHTFHDPEYISINFAQKSGSGGLLLFQHHNRNYLYIYAEHDKLIYIYKNQGKILEVTGHFTNYYSDHEVAIIRRNNTVAMSVDGILHTGSTAFSTNRVRGEIYIGGLPAEVEEEIKWWFKHKFDTYKGCIKSIQFGEGSNPVNVLAEGIVRKNYRRTCDVLTENKSIDPEYYSNSGEYDEEYAYDLMPVITKAS